MVDNLNLYMKLQAEDEVTRQNNGKCKLKSQSIVEIKESCSVLFAFHIKSIPILFFSQCVSGWNSTNPAI